MPTPSAKTVAFHGFQVVLEGQLYGRIIVAVIALITLVADYFNGSGICAYLSEHWGLSTVVGAVAFIAVCIFGAFSKHRTFTHSVLALVVLSIALWLVCPQLVAPFAIGFASHIVLDLTNKKDVQILYPSEKGKFCLGLCYAGGAANVVIMVLGIVASVALFVWCLPG